MEEEYSEELVNKWYHIHEYLSNQELIYEYSEQIKLLDNVVNGISLEQAKTLKKAHNELRKILIGSEVSFIAFMAYLYHKRGFGFPIIVDIIAMIMIYIVYKTAKKETTELSSLILSTLCDEYEFYKKGYENEMIKLGSKNLTEDEKALVYSLNKSNL